LGRGRYRGEVVHRPEWNSDPFIHELLHDHCGWHRQNRGRWGIHDAEGINIQATGQNIITLGDGNQINAPFSELGTALVRLRETITRADAPEQEKMSLVADIDTIESQLAKPQPNRGIIAAAWETVKRAAAIGGCADLVQRVGTLIVGLLP
jgi:hypothetical protein